MASRTARATHHPHVHFIAATVNYNDAGIAAGIVIGTLPKGALILYAGGNVETAFNAATTNVLTLGLEDDSGFDNIAGASGFTEGTPGGYSVPAPLPPLAAAKDVKVSYTQSGTAATTGKAHVFVAYIPKVY